jgi:hypothetical protein
MLRDQDRARKEIASLGIKQESVSVGGIEISYLKHIRLKMVFQATFI